MLIRDLPGSLPNAHAAGGRNGQYCRQIAIVAHFELGAYIRKTRIDADTVTAARSIVLSTMSGFKAQSREQACCHRSFANSGRETGQREEGRL